MFMYWGNDISILDRELFSNDRWTSSDIRCGSQNGLNEGRPLPEQKTNTQASWSLTGYAESHPAQFPKNHRILPKNMPAKPKAKTSPD